MTASDWISIVGTVVSVFGLIFSWCAWLQAKGAKSAAREAAALVRTRNLAHRFSDWAALAKDLQEAVRGLNLFEGRRLANDLLGGLSYIKGWRQNLGNEIHQVDDLIEILDFICGYLEDEDAFIAMQNGIAQDCRKVLMKLQELSGKFDAKLEAM